MFPIAKTGGHVTVYSRLVQSRLIRLSLLQKKNKVDSNLQKICIALSLYAVRLLPETFSNEILISEM